MEFNWSILLFAQGQKTLQKERLKRSNIKPINTLKKHVISSIKESITELNFALHELQILSGIRSFCLVRMWMIPFVVTWPIADASHWTMGLEIIHTTCQERSIVAPVYQPRNQYHINASRPEISESYDTNIGIGLVRKQNSYRAVISNEFYPLSSWSR